MDIMDTDKIFRKIHYIKYVSSSDNNDLEICGLLFELVVEIDRLAGIVAQLTDKRGTVTGRSQQKTLRRE